MGVPPSPCVGPHPAPLRGSTPPRNRLATVAFAFAVACLAHSTRADANAQGMYGFGSRSTAMAGAVSADVRDFSANYYNPAGLAAAETLRIDIGYFWAHHALTANGLDNHVDPAHGLVGGIAAPGRLFGIPFAFGLGLHLPDDRVSRSRALPQMQPRWELYDNRVQIIFIAANLAIAPVRWLRLGAGLSFVSSTRGRLDISGEINGLRTNDSRLNHTVDADLTAVRYLQAGIQVDVHPTLTFAATYRGTYNLRLEIDAIVAGRISLGDLGIPGSYSLFSSSVAVSLPQQGVLGVSWRPRRDFTLDVDLTWINWSAYVNPTANIRVALDLQVPPELSSFRIPATPSPTPVVPARFADTFVPRVGVEFRRDVGVHTLAFRGGYRFDASPVPDQMARATNFMDANRHVVSFGTGMMFRGMRPTLAGGISVDLHADLQVLEHRDVHKDDPSDPVGDYRLAGAVFQAGITTGVVF